MLTGDLLIGSHDVPASAGMMRAYSPAKEAEIDPCFAFGGADEVDRAARLADDAFNEYSHAPVHVRARLLDRIADHLDRVREMLAARLALETGLPLAQLEAEGAKAAVQFRQFADLIRDGRVLRMAIDPADPARTPRPRLDHRLQRVALGPVAIFGASNFPISYSVAGGDTASALAAGCPVIVKAHNAHPGGSEIMARAIREAVEICGLPEGIFSLVRGEGNMIGEALVAHPLVKAVTFTGSEVGGMALYRKALARDEPIPVFAEMTSVNPTFVLPGALAARGRAIGDAFGEQMLANVGQACLKPGILLAEDGEGYEAMRDALAARVTSAPARPMLGLGICRAYRLGAGRLEAGGALRVAAGEPARGAVEGEASLFETDAVRFLAEPAMAGEVFGPAALLVRAANREQVLAAARSFRGQLSAAIFAEEEDYTYARQLLPTLERRTGRLIVNDLSRPQEVGQATIHGGPFPATSDGRFTSVGMSAIERFQRPVCYQNFPDELLPHALRESNPLGAWRLRDGTLEQR